ncbi:MAG: DEAD/DEAH box helicase family protein [Phycisphaerae bacterium]|nr:DEAD/DEAH box helicase family protein [Phycisphaerae bacterium]
MPRAPEHPNIEVGKPVSHGELGEGVVLGIEPTGFIRVYFRTHGERQVPADALAGAMTWEQRVLSSLRPGTPEAIERLALAIEAEELPLMESAAVLTSAKVDLLPHQVVLVHRMANARPRRFLVADEVGLGKTIETALILRELASRGELQRALMIVPAGLVENWRRELNDVFNLDFEVFGSEGDVSDRKSNAFAKHNRMIASIDTLKRPQRLRRIKEAPVWDLVVFDEAHHLSVYKSGRKSTKTQNYKLAEAMREHSRDLLLLSATPHQGDHYRFWMLVRLLDPSLFEDESDMVDNRHRLNAVVIRRTKADACDARGGPLFARRQVHTEAFSLSDTEKVFYSALSDYLNEGYALAEQLGGKSRALGFVMTIFQKIAASSFSAVRATLRKRLLMLTLQEAIERDEALDVDGRNRALDEARDQIRDLHGLPADAIGRAQVDQILADLKVQLLRKRDESFEFVKAPESMDDSEAAAAMTDETAASMVLVALPEERRRIRELLDRFPPQTETKTTVLLGALEQLWKLNPQEKVVIFTTYLGSIDSLRTAIEWKFPGKRVEVLKGGDHGAKTAAQKRFKRPDGPCVLLTTAAGREGINLQFARVLFNHDLPWNPMDLEQRIGRIHRYGQEHTAQVYNLVAADTIEGQIFLLLEDKLREIATALGKVDDQGQIAEDLRSQILGQLGSRLSYDKLYQDALRDPSLQRTKEELEVAMSNASLARHVVFELFQDLEKFNLGEYQKFDDKGEGMRRLVAFVQRASALFGGQFVSKDDTRYVLIDPDKAETPFTTDRDEALREENVELLGLEHPAVSRLIESCRQLEAERRFVSARTESDLPGPGLSTVWRVIVQADGGKVDNRVVRLGFDESGDRSLAIERVVRSFGGLKSSDARPDTRDAGVLVARFRDALHREMSHAGLLSERGSYSTNLLGAVAIEAGIG